MLQAQEEEAQWIAATDCKVRECHSNITATQTVKKFFPSFAESEGSLP